MSLFLNVIPGERHSTVRLWNICIIFMVWNLNVDSWTTSEEESGYEDSDDKSLEESCDGFEDEEQTNDEETERKKVESEGICQHCWRRGPVSERCLSCTCKNAHCVHCLRRGTIEDWCLHCESEFWLGTDFHAFRSLQRKPFDFSMTSESNNQCDADSKFSKKCVFRQLLSFTKTTKCVAQEFARGFLWVQNRHDNVHVQTTVLA